MKTDLRNWYWWNICIHSYFWFSCQEYFNSELQQSYLLKCCSVLHIPPSICYVLRNQMKISLLPKHTVNINTIYISKCKMCEQGFLFFNKLIAYLTDNPYLYFLHLLSLNKQLGNLGADNQVFISHIIDGSQRALRYCWTNAIRHFL